jgi:UDP-glucose 4-epimerase
MSGMRILVTGLGTFWGSRLAQELEQLDGVETIVGLDSNEPRLPLERTEFVRADSNYSILERIVRATKVDTILHTHLVVDSTEISGRALHEINVIGTMNLLAAAGAAGSPVRKVIVKSSTLMYGANYKDPYFFRETQPRTRPPRTRVERSLLDAAAFVRDFAIDNPHMTVTKLRFSNVLGDDINTTFSHALRLPVVPEIFGFDPRLQFTHEDDVTGALLHATLNDVPGIYNIAGDGAMPWSEVCTIVGKRRIALPPLLTAWAAEPLRMLRIVDLPPEVLSLLRYGRGVDNSPFKRAGFRYQYSTAGTVDAFARGLRLERAVGEKHPAYKFEGDVETFFRHSPAVVRGDS